MGFAAAARSPLGCHRVRAARDRAPMQVACQRRRQPKLDQRVNWADLRSATKHGFAPVLAFRHSGCRLPVQPVRALLVRGGAAAVHRLVSKRRSVPSACAIGVTVRHSTAGPGQRGGCLDGQWRPSPDRVMPFAPGRRWLRPDGAAGHGRSLQEAGGRDQLTHSMRRCVPGDGPACRKAINASRSTMPPRRWRPVFSSSKPSPPSAR